MEQFEKELSENVIIFGYTSNCGTCKIGEKMLDIAVSSFSEIEVRKINLSLFSNVVNAYKVSSIPCFILLKNGELFDQFYAFQSVTYIYKKIDALIKSNTV